ncbi:MAG: ABC transporter ATP-binding protein/permease [archaeon]|nr:ABC transporter ATP-binding protein/permease [archaeon]
MSRYYQPKLDYDDKPLTKEEKKIRNKKIKKMVLKSLKFFAKAKIAIIVFVILELIVSGLGVIFPMIQANLVDGITSFNLDIIKVNIILLIVCELGSMLLSFINAILWSTKIRNKVSFAIRKHLVDNIMKLKISNFDVITTGTFSSRINGDALDIVITVQQMESVIANIISNIGVIAFVFVLNFWIGLLFVFAVALGITYNILTENKKMKLVKESKTSDEKVKSIITEFVRGIRDVKTLNLKEIFKEKINAKITARDEANAKVVIFRNTALRVVSLIYRSTGVIAIILGVKFIGLNLLTGAEVIAIYLYSNRIQTLGHNVTQFIQIFNDYKISLERVFEFEDDEKYPKEKFGDKHIDNVEGKVTFDNVTFGYNDQRTILKNMSFNIIPKQKVALVGASGSGKTTALSLLTKNYTVDEGKGRILIDDINIEEFDEESFRKSISVISQTPYIFNISIRENLLLVKEDATEDELIDVCKKAMLYDYIKTLPDGLDSIIGEGGLNLSGGQRQRLAIARALLKDCKILIFDEATSALDNITQKEIQKSIDNLQEDYTIIIVAHRLSTIKDVDKIFLLKDGNIKCSGTHEELLCDEDYKKLYEADEA